MVRALQRQRPAPLTLNIDPGFARGSTRAIAVMLDAHDAEGKPQDFLNPHVRVQSGSKAPVDIAARQTAPGHYEVRAIVDAGDTLAATVVGSDTASGLFNP